MSSSTQTVIVTGATRGLGRATAERLLADGFSVIGTGRSSQAPEDWPSHPRLHYASLDLTEASSFHQFAQTLERPPFGLVNNAALGLDGVLATMHDREIERLVSANLTGTILFSKYIVRAMIQQPEPQGRVINVASIIARTGFNGLSVYAATKAGLLGFSRSLARELGKMNITVNAVLPGYMETDMTGSLSEDNLERIQRRSPLGRLVSPAEVAATISYLLSQDAAGVTGAEFVIDAGTTA